MEYVRRETGKNAKAKGRERELWDALFQAQSCSIYQHTAVVIACTRPAQDTACQHSIMDASEAYKIPYLSFSHLNPLWCPA